MTFLETTTAQERAEHAIKFFTMFKKLIINKQGKELLPKDFVLDICAAVQLKMINWKQAKYLLESYDREIYDTVVRNAKNERLAT